MLLVTSDPKYIPVQEAVRVWRLEIWLDHDRPRYFRYWYGTEQDLPFTWDHVQLFHLLRGYAVQFIQYNEEMIPTDAGLTFFPGILRLLFGLRVVEEQMDCGDFTVSAQLGGGAVFLRAVENQLLL